MDHSQFEMLVAAILTSSLAQKKGIEDPAEAVTLLTMVHREVVSREIVTKQSANFIPKGR